MSSSDLDAYHLKTHLGSVSVANLDVVHELKEALDSQLENDVDLVPFMEPAQHTDDVLMPR